VRTDRTEGGTRLFEMQRAAKAAEEDAQRLSNRVKQLMMEEKKAEKRIEETRKRAAEVMELRERNERKVEEKREHSLRLVAEVQAQAEKHRLIKLENERRKAEAEQSLALKKKAAGRETKVEAEEHERRIAEMRVLERKKALESKEVIRTQQTMFKKKMSEEKTVMSSKFKEEYEERIVSEIRKKEKQERDLQKMAQKELELIERLKAKQEAQKAAYQELEKALGVKDKASARRSVDRLSTRGPKPPVVRASAPASSGASASAPPAASEPDEKEIERQFSALDTDASGAIKLSFLDTLMRRLGVELNPDQLHQATKQLDRNDTGTITFGEFLLWWRG